MLIVGLLLIVVSAAGATLVLSYNWSGGPEQMVVIFGRDWITTTPLQAFIAGMAVMLVFSLGLWMVARTERRRREVRAEYRAVRREARTATKERDHLAKELAERDEVAERQAWSEPPTTPTPIPPPQHGETTETQSPKRGFGRHFRRSDSAAEKEQPASSSPPQ